ncbi:MAG: tRNA lysidine(34) synthetase TilS [Bacteroidales bacterium]|nr:tRNA lysidine(34) synthetase TilS [Bacteroidales bacterium]
MIEQFRKYIADNHLIKEGDRILVALSGGVDSMVLAELLRRCGYNIAFAHCNFRLRGAESDGDEQFVREYADRVGVKLFVKQFDTHQYVADNKVSVEMAARDLRYAWFNDLINANQHVISTERSEWKPERSESIRQRRINLLFDKLALAHHADDQIETFFINLLRGSGIKGLKAMQPCNGMYIRPLLWASREEIRRFAVDNGINWREDSTNNDTVYLRNKIRHDLMPVFDSIKAEAREKILESINHLSAENQLYRELLQEKISQIETVDGVLHTIKKRHFDRSSTKERAERRNLLQSESLYFAGDSSIPLRYTRNDGVGKQLLFEWIRTFGFSYSQCESIFAALDSEPGKEFYSDDYQLVVEKRTIDIFPRNMIADTKAISFKKIEKTVNFQLVTDNSNIAQLDYDKLKLPLQTRFWQQGDRFRPLGMRGTKLVSDFFNDNNFTTFQKKTTLILTDSDNQIVWIAGYRIDDRFKITEKTKTIYQINFDN